MNWWKSEVHVLILRQNISLSSLTVGKTSLLCGWKSLALRTCGHLGYSATCPQRRSRKPANCKIFAWSLAPLLICRSNLNWQINVDLIQQLREKLAYLKPPDSVQRPRVSRYGLKTLLCIFWNSFDVFYHTLQVVDELMAILGACPYFASKYLT